MGRAPLFVIDIQLCLDILTTMRKQNGEHRPKDSHAL
jgi:hypothetical protein